MYTTTGSAADIATIEPIQSWALEAHAPAGGAARNVDLLFLHGMAVGSWVWSPEWITHFTDAGYRCWTMSLPGRAGGATVAFDAGAFDRALGLGLETGDAGMVLDALAKALPGASLFDGPDLDDYSDALAEALDRIEAPCVVVSHSLGGAVAQNLMRRGTRAAGNVLICSAPPYGTWRASMEMAFTNLPLWKALFDFSIFGVAATDVAVMRANLFPGGIADEDYERLLTRFSDESLAATARTSGFFGPFPGPRHDMLVIGAGRDRFVPPLDVHLTGLYYGCAAQIIAGAGHMPMCEPAFAGQTATRVLDWLDDTSFDA